HAAALLLEHGSLAGVAAIVLAFQIFHEGAKRGGCAARFEAARQVGKTIDIGQNALSAFAKSEAGMGARGFEQPVDSIRDGAVVAYPVQFTKQLKAVSN